MSKFKCAIVLVVACLFVACSIGNYSGKQQNTKDYADVDTNNRASSAREYSPNSTEMNFIQMLRTRPGISVIGQGNNMEVRINNLSSSPKMSSSPLFVLDGLRMGHDVLGVNEVVQGANIKSIIVLKDPSDTSIYGVAGSNGVILIKTK